ncbi:MAG: molecular chaperone TorD family protein [Rhodospirillales bacterium]|nr:molecular chaperone TorD family protein [Rhodospirillales bacterium]
MISDEDLERAEAYALIGRLFAAPPDDGVLEMLGELEGDDSPLGRAVAALAVASRDTNAADAGGEFSDLFVGLTTREEVSPYGAVQTTGSMFGEALLKVRADLGEMGIGKAEDVSETEDHIALLCQVMTGLLRRELGTDVTPEKTGAFFKAHIAPWAPKFAKAVEATESARFYSAVARFSRLFWESETIRYDR